jgi:hypothetical protein
MATGKVRGRRPRGAGRPPAPLVTNKLRVAVTLTAAQVDALWAEAARRGTTPQAVARAALVGRLEALVRRVTARHLAAVATVRRATPRTTPEERATRAAREVTRG